MRYFYIVPFAFVLACFPYSSVAALSFPTETYLAFDGTDDQIKIVDHSSWYVTDSITMEAWIKPGAISTSTAQDRVVSKGVDCEITISKGDTGCSFGTKGDVQWRATIGGKNVRICGGSLSSDVWHHVAGTFNGGMLALYVDGVLAATASKGGSIATNSNNLVIGNHPTLPRPYDGSIDEVRIWSRALSQQEIQDKINLELSGDETGLVAYYRFNEGSGQNVFDSTASGNNGILGTTTGPDASDPIWVVSGPPVNQPPVVDAGPDRTIILPANTVTLSGSVSDDGLPNGTVITAWSKVSGPGTVIFADASAVSTSVAFSEEGSYVLRLSADDSKLTANDEVIIQIEPSILTSISIAPDSVILNFNSTRAFSATGFNQANEPIPINPFWDATGGTIDAAGIFTAGETAGQFRISATEGVISSVATVFIRDPKIWPTEGWMIATPAEMGMNQTKLEEARNYALTGGGSGVITRGGKLVMSWGTQSTLYDVKSTTKSIGVTVLGLALYDGLVDLNDSAQMHLPEIGIPPESNSATGWIDDITLLQLSTHTAGFDKPGGYFGLLFSPGTAWAYSDGGTNWLADVLTVVYGQDLNDLMFTRVFSLLGIDSSDLIWRSNRYRDDTISGIKRREFGAGITINVDAMARIGYLYLRGGEWDGQQIITRNFVDSVSTTVPEVVGLPVVNDIDSQLANASNHYGLLWWNNSDGSMRNVPKDAFWSWGLYDSLIVVIPSLDIVASRAGNAWAGSRSPIGYSVLEPFIELICLSITGN